MLKLRGKQLSREDQMQLAAMRKKLLERMVDELLLLAEAKRLGVAISDSEVENHIRQFKQKHNLSEEALSDQLRLEQLTRTDYEKMVREDMQRFRLLSGMVNRKVFVSEEEVQAYYEEHKSDFAQDRSVDLGLILVADPALGQDLAARIAAGEVSFEDAAAEHTIGPGKSRGGHLGEVKWKELSPEWKNAIKDLSDGGVSEPFALSGKTALLKLVSNTSGTVEDIENVRDEIRAKLFEPKYRKEYEDFLVRLRDKAIIDIRL
jgi:peptidyl-prolyl cis-trans isomerase SurA